MLDFEDFDFAGVYMSSEEITDENLKYLKELGVSAIFAPLKDKLSKKVKNHDLSFYSVKWTFKIPEPKDKHYFIQTIDRARVAWGFGQTGCPNNPKLLTHILQEIAHHIKNNPDVTALVLDGTRFPSPLEGLETYLSCFCKHCRKKAKSNEMDIERARLTLKKLLKIRKFKRLERFLQGTNRSISQTLFLDFLLNHRDLYEWLKFRERTITQKTKQIYKGIKELRPSIEVGHFLFSPSLAPMVGQNYERIGEYADFLSPMVYTSGDNIACIDGEIRGIAGALQKIFPNMRRESISGIVEKIIGIKFRWQEDTIQVSPKTVHDEIVKSRLLAKAKIRPTIFVLNKASARIEREINEARKEVNSIILFKYCEKLVDPKI